LLTQYGPSKLTDNGVFEYIIYNMVHTDLSFEQFTSIRDAVNEMHLDENPDNVLLRMRPHYLVQDFAFDPDTIDEHLHTYLDRIVPYLNNKDYSGATLEDVQNKLIAQIDAGLEDEQTIEWLYENNVWLQIEDDETRLSYEYEIVKSYARTLDSTEEKQKLLGDLVLEFEHIGADEWSQKARKDLEAIL